MDPLLQTDGAQLPAEAAGVPADLDALQNYIYGKPTHLDFSPEKCPFLFIARGPRMI